MWIELIIVVLQSLSVVALGIAGISEATKCSNGSLNRIGKVLFVSAALAYVFSTAILYSLATEKQNRSIKRIEGLQEKLLSQVMTAPPEIVQRVPENKPTTDLEILKPVSGGVDWRPLVEGKVADPKAKVWVVVHPVGLSSYWIQSPVTVRGNGTWQVLVYIGRAGDIDIGKRFEIMAIVGPQVALTEGQVFSEWPEAKWRSDILTVVRR